MRKKGGKGCLHGHGEGAFLRIGTCEGHPSNVKRMRESTEHLGPDNTEVAHVAFVGFGEDTVHDICQQVHAKTSYDSLTTSIAVVIHRISNPFPVLRTWCPLRLGFHLLVI